MRMTLTDLQQMFSSHGWPQFLALEMTENNVSLTLHIRHETSWLEGHFPHQPVLAGVVQTHWAATLGKTFFSVGDAFNRIDNLKFQSVVLPGQTLDLTLQYLPDVGAIKFAYQFADMTFSEGKLVFQPVGISKINCI
jgi:3-hydroxymyristoyl/3-hydroxydecanoyl-(acyl carrier protein) dehydratase